MAQLLLPQDFQRTVEGIPLKPNFLWRLSDVLLEVARAEGELPLEIRTDGTVLSMRLLNPLSSLAPRFAPSVMRGDPRAEAAAVWERMEHQHWTFMEDRAAVTPNPALRGHYNDVLWETRKLHRLPKPVRFAEVAVDGYMKWLEDLEQSAESWPDLKVIVRRVAELGLVLSRPSWIQSAFDRAARFVLVFEGETDDKPALILRVTESAIDIADAAKGRHIALVFGQLKELRGVLDRFVGHHAHPLAGDLRRSAEQCLGRIDALQGIGDPYLRRKAAADSLMDEAEFHMQHGNVLAASSFFMDAVEAYTGLADTKAAAAAKRRAREANAASISQMTKYRIEFSVPREAIETMIDHLLEPKAWGEILARCCESPELFPDLGDEESNEGTPESSLSDLTPSVSLVGDRQIARDPDGKASSQAATQALKVQHAVTLLWLPFLPRAIERGLTPQDLADVLQERGVIPEGHGMSIRRGLESFFKHDFISALHILVPQFEAALRSALAKLGVDVTAYRSLQGGRLQERTMSVFFDENDAADLASEVKAKLGERLWRWFKFVFVDERGLNVRNNVAHGLLQDEQIDNFRAAAVVLAFIGLIAVSTPPSQDEIPSQA